RCSWSPLATTYPCHGCGTHRPHLGSGRIVKLLFATTEGLKYPSRLTYTAPKILICINIFVQELSPNARTARTANIPRRMALLLQGLLPHSSRQERPLKRKRRTRTSPSYRGRLSECAFSSHSRCDTSTRQNRPSSLPDFPR